MQRADDDVIEHRQTGEGFDDLKSPADAAGADLIGSQAVDSDCRRNESFLQSGASAPAMRLNSVVLPAPLGPMRATMEFGCDAERNSAHGAQAAKGFVDVLDFE